MKRPFEKLVTLFFICSHVQTEIHFTEDKRSMEPLTWFISKALWSMPDGERNGEEESMKNEEEEQEGREGALTLTNRHHPFNRPPFGKVLRGAANVNHPGFFSSSAHKPSFMACSGRPCTLPPNAFWGRTKIWAPPIRTIYTTSPPYTLPPIRTTGAPFFTAFTGFHKPMKWDDHYKG